MTEPSVHVRTGTLLGNEHPASHGHPGYFEFLGVPYARAPRGPAAFLPPLALASTDDAVACHRHGASAHRRNGSGFIPEPVIDGDNALNLNVWTPTLGAAGLPVFVWIHGGGFTGGSNASPWYHGGSFARHGVVSVAINYRLGPEGYLQVAEGNANRGVLDMITALGWVQENIAALGGDPGRVTIGGQSAGGSGSLALFTSAAAKGLFRRSAVQSSGGMTPASPGEASAMAEHFARSLGVALDATELAGAAAARRAEIEGDYLPSSAGRRPAWEADQGGRAFGRETLTWRPSIDGSVIEADTYSRAREGRANGEALIIGTTAEEFNGVVAQAAAQMTEVELTDALQALGIDRAGLASYLELGRDRTSLAWAFGQAYTDWRFRIPAAVMADAATAGGIDVFKYEFRFAARTPGPGAHRSQHSSDIPFVFDNLAADAVADSVGADAPQALADDMHGAWVRFIEGKEPWARYQPGAEHTMVFDGGSRLRDDVGATLAALWGDSAGSTRPS